MSEETRFQTGFTSEQTGEPGLVRHPDGTVWLVNTDGSETQLPGGGGGSTVYQSPTDPGAVGAGAFWVNTTGISGTSDLPLSVRDPGNTFWSPVGLAHYDGTGQLRGFVTMTDSAIVIEKKDADGANVAFFLVADDHVYISTFNAPIWIAPLLGGTTWGISNPSGAEKFGGISPSPDDSEVNASQQIVWFDSTPGATATRFMNQDSDATPTSGQLAALSDDATQILQGASIQWVTVQASPPGADYITPLVQDTTPVTGGTYAWDGSAYQKIGNVVS